MASTLNVKIEVSQLLTTLDFAETSIFGDLSKVVQDVVEIGEQRWIEAAKAAKMWDGERQRYVASISSRMIGPFEGEISNTYKFARDIEEGRPAYDMKPAMLQSMKVRVAKAGKHAGQRYLIIPMRQNTPGNTALALAMPDHVYSEARLLSKSQITGTGSRKSGTGALDIKTRRRFLVPQHKYRWGDRLPAGLTPKLKPHHTTDIHAGMVRMKNATGGASYLTFRVMGEWQSDKWIMAARPGQWIAKNVADSLGRTAEDMFGNQIKREIAA